MDQLSETYLKELSQQLHSRNEILGYQRYDTADIYSSNFFLKHLPGNGGIATKIFRAPEVIFPIAYRKLLKVEPKVIPVSFYHLGSFYLNWSKLYPEFDFDLNILLQMIEDCGNQMEYLCWEHPYPHHYIPLLESSEINNDYPKSCAHHTSRLAKILLEIGYYKNNEAFIEKGNSALNALLKYHNWEKNGDDSMTVSYYPFTNDKVINTAAETAAAFAVLKEEAQTEQHIEKVVGVVKMLLKEINEDGSWCYYTKEHYEQKGGTAYIDTAHTGMNIAAISELLAADLSYLSTYKKQLQELLVRSLQFCIDGFYDDEKQLLNYLVSKKGESTLAGYCECIIAFSKVLIHNNADIPESLADRMREVLDGLLQRVLSKFLNTKTYDVASQVMWNMFINFRSHRVGSGLLMDAISNYMLYKRGIN